MVRRFARPAAAALSLLLLFSLALRAEAASLTWTGASDSNWFNAANWSPSALPTSVDSVLIDTNATISAAGATSISFATLTLGDASAHFIPTLRLSAAESTAGTVVVSSGATLQQDTNQQVGFGALTVMAGGVLTHTANSSARSALINLNIAGDFNLQAGATIEADGLGYAGGTQHVGFGPGGGGIGALGYYFGTSNGGGGGHKGLGGNADGVGGAAYDSLTNPTDLGSGGGSSGGGDTGGSGGGAVLIQVGGSFSLNGLISANGAPGRGNGFFGSASGGGSGGTINITAVSMTGSGILRAAGGDGGWSQSRSGGAINLHAGGGGGGLVALAVTGSDTSNLSKQVNAGVGAVSSNMGPGGPGLTGGAGTIAIKTPASPNYNLVVGDLVSSVLPQSNTPITGAALAFSTVTFNNGIVTFDAGSNVTINSLNAVGTSTVSAAGVALGSNAGLLVKPASVLALTAGSLSFGSNAPIEVQASATLKLAASSMSGAVLNVRTGGVFLQPNAQPLSFASVLVESGGVMAHAANASSRTSVLNLNVAGDFNFLAGAKIAADGLGYAGGTAAPGVGFGPGGGGVGQLGQFFGTSNGGGGGHIGNGGAANGAGGSAYDAINNPTDLGSGGGSSGAGDAGGAGGGSVIIQVGGTFNLNGLISAMGAPGAGNGWLGAAAGGGSGGTINITAVNLTGSGTLRAKGGDGGWSQSRSGGQINLHAGGGGGGAIAVVVTGTDSSSFSEQVNAGVGAVSSNLGPGGPGITGGAGTISIKEPGNANYNLVVGDLVASVLPQSKTPIPGAVAVYSAVTFNNAIASFDSGSTANINSLTAVGIATVTANNLIFGSGGIEVKPGGVLAIGANAASGGSLLVDGGGTFEPTNTASLNFTSVNLQAGGAISADGVGYPGATSAGQGGSGPGGGGSSGGGGGYGGHGQGTGGVGGLTYGNVFDPADEGSGGGANGGGAGGGAVRLQVAGTFTSNGVISANGAAGANGTGGGAGGTVNISAASLAGSGTILADGGKGPAAGGGGGGRIALFYGSKASSWHLEANGGSGSTIGGIGTIFDNGQLVNTVQLSAGGSLGQVQQSLTSAQNISEAISAQVIDFSGAVATGTTPGTFSVAQVQLVTVQSGSFAGDGFFTGNWTLALPSGGSLSGTWKGTAFLSQSPRQIVLNGAVQGGVRGVLEGVLTETVPGSGTFNKVAVTCSALQIGGQLGAGSLSLSGSGVAQQAVQYSGVALRLLQTSLTGPLSGDYAGSLETTFTLLRVNDPTNVFYGQGFYLPSYSATAGTGIGWAYASGPSPQAVVLTGLLEQPLRGLFEGALTLGTPQTAAFTVGRLDVGLPTQPILTFTTTQPRKANGGETNSFSVTIRNDGYAAATSVSVVAVLPDWSSFAFASGKHVVYNAANWWKTTSIFAPIPFVRWDIGQIPPRSSTTLTYQATVLLPVVGGPGRHELIGGGEIEIMSTDWANQLFAAYPIGGTR